MNEQRPTLNKQISLKDFKDFYWLKSELQAFCKKNKIPANGAKLILANRIEYYLSTGKIKSIQANKASSAFDWQNEPLTLQTLITDSYKNTENVRSFFLNNIGPSFKFNVKFMNWMKQNHGSNLQDAIKAYESIKNSKIAKNIEPQFEYNRYMRDCKAAFPNLSHKEVVSLWNIKRSTRGSKVFSKQDLDLLNAKY